MNRKGLEGEPDHGLGQGQPKQDIIDIAPKLPTEVQVSPAGSSCKPPKKKRKSPAVPWKKPKDMPKRPLSGYNLFFAAERQKLLKGEGVDLDSKPSAGGKKTDSGVGIGFASLAQRVAAKWKTLSDTEKAPFTEQAAIEKKKYDKDVAEWRKKRKEQKELEKQKAAKSITTKAPPSPDHLSVSSSHSLEIGTIDEAYPSDWFRTGTSGRGYHHGHVTDDSSSRAFDESFATYGSSSHMSLEYTQPTATAAVSPQRSSTEKLQLPPRPRLQSSSHSDPTPLRRPMSMTLGGQRPTSQDWIPSRRNVYATTTSETESSGSRGLWHSETFPPGPTNQFEKLEPHEFAVPLSDEGRAETRNPSRDLRAPDISAGFQRSSGIAPWSFPAFSNLQDEPLYSNDLRGTAISGPPNPQLLRTSSLPAGIRDPTNVHGREHTTATNLPQRSQIRQSQYQTDIDTIGRSASAPSVQQRTEQQEQQEQGDDNDQASNIETLTEHLDDDTIDFITRIRFS